MTTEKLTDEEFVKHVRDAFEASANGWDDISWYLREALDRIELLLIENLRLRSLMRAHLPPEIVVLKNPEGNATGEVELGSIDDLKSRFDPNQVCATKETSGGE